MNISDKIVKKALSLGASLAGIADAGLLARSPSHKQHGKTVWPEQARSVLVMALVHDPESPELDWWDEQPGGTPGNRQLMALSGKMKQALEEEFGICALPSPYAIEKGGIFLKDAAVLAGLGIIGRNNLLITPEFGPHVRLRALFMDADLPGAGAPDYSPCAGCAMPCRQACPRQAFEKAVYDRPPCKTRMIADEDEGEARKAGQGVLCIRYCRACELACPAAFPMKNP